MSEQSISGLAERGASVMHAAFRSYRGEFNAITRRARIRFEQRDWHGMQDDALERLELYKKIVDGVVAETQAVLGKAVNQGTNLATDEKIVSLVKAGKLRPLMIVGDEKDTAFPETPIPRELGYTFKTFPLMEGVAAPKGLPPDRLSRLEKAFDDASKDPRFKRWADETKTDIVHFSSKAFSQKIAETYSEVEKYKGELKSEK